MAGYSLYNTSNLNVVAGQTVPNLVTVKIGAGGLAKTVPPVITEPGRAIVYGHGVYSIGRDGFAEAFQSLVDVENWCRAEYFKRFDQRNNRHL